MKDFLTPVSTPAFLSTGLDINTPSAPGPRHYFAASHQLARAQDGGEISSKIIESVFDEDLLNEKLSSLETAKRLGPPIDSIPNEVLSLILEHGYFDFSRAGLPDRAFRSLAAQVSSRFRAVTIYTPSLWSVIHLSPGNVFDELDILPVYLKCSGDYPLDVQLSSFWASDITDSVMDVLVPQSKRWRRLSITTINEYILSFLQHAAAPFLRYLAISHFSHQRRVSLPASIFDNHLPSLEFLCLRNVDIDKIDFSLRGLKVLEIRGYGTWPTYSRLSEMLAGSASLQHLTLHVKAAEIIQQVRAEQSVANADAQILLPELQIMEVYTSEWLTADITNLIRLFACPKLQSLVVRENVNSPVEHAHTIMSYTALPSTSGPPPSTVDTPSAEEPWCAKFPRLLFVRSASVYLSCLAVSAVTLTTLELRKVFWPTLETMKETFAALKNLEVLFILDLSPSEALVQIMSAGMLDLYEVDLNEAESSITIPSLQTLLIDFSPRADSCTGYTASFIRLFSLPGLSSLLFKNLTLRQWESIVECFSTRSSDYPVLTSLKLTDMTNLLPTNPLSLHSVDPTHAFPHLQRLALNRVASNAFMHHLLPKQRPITPSYLEPTESSNADSMAVDPPVTVDATTAACAWPSLHTLAICGDTNASEPLLHRVIATREEMGSPLEKLSLDKHFFANAESVEWIRERVDVVEANAGIV